MTLPTPAAALAWLRAHPRLAEALACALCLAFGYVLHRPAAPTISAHSSEQTHQVATTQHQEQTATQAQQATQANTSEKLDESKHVATHKEIHVLPSGERTIVIDSHSEDELHVEEAQQVSVTFNFAQLALVADASYTDMAVSKRSAVTQTPAPAPRFELGAMAGMSTHGKVFEVPAALRVGDSGFKLRASVVGGADWALLGGFSVEF